MGLWSREMNSQVPKVPLRFFLGVHLCLSGREYTGDCDIIDAARQCLGQIHVDASHVLSQIFLDFFLPSTGPLSYWKGTDRLTG
jgi:hypothetical protein